MGSWCAEGGDDFRSTLGRFSLSPRYALAAPGGRMSTSEVSSSFGLATLGQADADLCGMLGQVLSGLLKHTGERPCFAHTGG